MCIATNFLATEPRSDEMTTTILRDNGGEFQDEGGSGWGVQQISSQ